MEIFYIHLPYQVKHKLQLLRKSVTVTQCLILKFPNKLLSLINPQTYVYAQSHAQTFDKHQGVYS